MREWYGCSGVAHKGYNPIRSRSCSSFVFFRAHRIALPCPALPCLSCRSAACRAALCSPRAAPCSPRATLCSPLAAPCSTRAALQLPALLRTALLAGALQTAPPCCCPPCCAPPCWPTPCCLCAALLAVTPPCPSLRAPLVLSARAPPCLRAALLAARHPALPAMASPSVLTFDHDGRLIQFDTWLVDLQLYLLSNSRDNVSLFDHTSEPSLAPPATADSATCSQWLTRDAAARLTIRNHLPLAERAHFGQHKTAKALYDAVVALEDLVTHLRNSDARYRAALPAEFLDRNPPPMYITLYFIVTRLPDSLRAARDHFLALDPTYLTIDLLEKHLSAAETSVVAVDATRGTPRTPFFEGCSPSPLAPSNASAAAVDILGAEDVGAASALSRKRRSSKGKGGKSGGSGSGGGGGGGSGGGGGGGGGGSGGCGGRSGGFGGGGGGSSGGGSGGGGGGSGSGGGGSGGGRGGAVQRGGSGGGQWQHQQRLSETPTPQQLPWGKFHSQHRCFSRLDDAWRLEFGDEAKRPSWSELIRSGVDIFALDYDAILAAMYALSVSAEGDSYLCVPPDPGVEAAALGASEFALPGTAPAEALHTFTLDSGASRYFFRDSTNLTPFPAPVPVRLADPSWGPVLARSSTVLPCPAILSGSLSGLHLPSFSTTLVSASGPVAAPCLCCLLSHQTLLWHHRLGHPSLPCLRGMHSRLLVSGLPRSLPPLPPLPAPPCLPCVEGRQCVAPHSSSFPLTTAPLQTLHMDMWGPARVVRLQLCERFRKDLPILRLHSDRGGEFSSDLLREFCRGEGILQSFTLPASPQPNGVVERRISLVMEVARTSMIHVAAPNFLWLFAVRYTVHQLNLCPVSPCWRPLLHCVGRGRSAMRRCSGSRALVPLSAILPRTSSPPALFPASSLAFPLMLLAGSFTTPPRAVSSLLRTSRLTIRFPFTVSSPTVLPLSPPPPLFLAPGPPLVDPGAEPEGADSRGAEVGGTEPGDAEPGGTKPEGAEPWGAEFEGAEFGGAEPWGTASAGGSAGASPRLSPWREPLSPQQLREWFAQHTCLKSGTAGARGSAAGGTGVRDAGATSLGGAGVTAEAGGTECTGAAGPGGARTRGTRAAGAGGVGNSRAEDPGAGGTGAGVAGAGGTRAGDPGAGGAGAGGTGAGDAGAGGGGAGDPRTGGTSAGGTGAGGAGAGDSGTGGARAGDTGAGDRGAGGAGASGSGA
ncbi:unnamed protein product [Closterium sp. NIES-54]